MPTTNIFTEEGRTRFRNFQRRFGGYVTLSLLLGITIAGAFFIKFTLRRLQPLQRLYLKQYIVASVKAAMFKKSSSRYTLLLLTAIDPATGKEVTHGVTDQHARPARDASGKLIKDPTGYRFSLYPGIQHNAFFWRRAKLYDRDMAPWLKQNIYDNTSAMALFYPAMGIALLVLVVGTASATTIDWLANRRYMEGNLLRGTRAIHPKNYQRQASKETGLGIPVSPREKAGVLDALLRRKQRYCWLRIAREREVEHTLLLGDPGTGKSQIIHNFLAQIARRQPAEAVVIYDPACEFVEGHFNRKRGDIVLNPLDARSPYWSPCFEIRYETDRKLIAESFFPGRALDSGASDFFIKASRSILARLLEFDPTVKQIVEWLRDSRRIDLLVKGTEHAHLIDQKAPNQRGGVLGTLSHVGETLKLLPGRDECQSLISLTEWARHRKGWIFITSTQDTREQLRPLQAVYIDILMKRLMTVRQDWGTRNPCWVMVDEAHSLKRLPSLYAAETEGRKYGLKVVLGTQNKHQFEEHYGKSALTMLSAPHLKIFLRCNEPESAKWVSDMIGEDEREKLKIGTTAAVDAKGRDSINYATITERRSVISKEEIMALPNLQGYWKYDDKVVPFRFEARNYPLVARGFEPRKAIFTETTPALDEEPPDNQGPLTNDVEAPAITLQNRTEESRERSTNGQKEPEQEIAVADIENILIRDQQDATLDVEPGESEGESNTDALVY